LTPLLILILFSGFSYAALNDNSVLQLKQQYIKVPEGKVWSIIYSKKSLKDNIPLLIINGGPGMPHNYLNVLSKLSKAVTFFCSESD